jgi:molybdenum cofactor cytidylyltransferase
MSKAHEQQAPPLGLVLAAGRGMRFDPHKVRDKVLQIIEIDARRSALVAHVSVALRAVLEEVWVITRPDLTDAVYQVCPPDVRVKSCPQADRGIGSVLSWAAGQAGPRPLVVALGDMPWLLSTSIATVLDAFGADRDVACAPSYAGRRGHPVAFPASWHAALCALEGERGAASLLELRGWRGIAVDDPGVVRDIDTPADMRRPLLIR